MDSAPAISVIAPARDEALNVEGLVDAVYEALRHIEGGFELIIVDDGSVDDICACVRTGMDSRPWLRCIALDGHAGQSAALGAGIRAARADVIAMMDADLQNDPGDLPRMIGIMREQRADMVQGDRSASRLDGPVRRAEAHVGRMFRRALLHDATVDTGCSLRVMTRPLALDLPLEFEGMHRFIPFCARSLGYRVVETPVSHRARAAGRSKYGAGIRGRALAGLLDCLMARRMFTRRQAPRWTEIGGAP